MDTGDLDYDWDLKRNFVKMMSMTIRSESAENRVVLNIQSLDYYIRLGSGSPDSQVYLLIQDVIFDGSSVNADLPDGYTFVEDYNVQNLFDVRTTEKFYVVVDHSRIT